MYKSLVKLAYTLTKKAMSKLVDKYMENNRLLIKRLEIMKNESNILIFISLNKVAIIQKHWLITKYNK